MGKTPGFRVICRGLLVIMAAAVLFCAGDARAVAVPANDTEVQDQYNTDPNINTTCDNSVFNEQYNAIGEGVKNVQLAVLDTKRDKPMTDQTHELNVRLGDFYFCPLKITTLNGIMATLSSIAGGIMAAVIAAAQAFIVTLINTVLQGICNYLIGLIDYITSFLCIPSLPTFQLKVPNFSFPTAPTANNCSGLKLISVTGGPPLVNPPLSYGATIPGTNWQGRINIIQ